MKRKFQQLSICVVLVVFWATFMTDIVESRRGGSSSSSSRSSTPRSTGTRTSKTTTRQKQTSTQNRRQVQQLKAQNRTLKRQVRRTHRETARARRDQRATINANNYSHYYPMTGYSTYNMTDAMAFDNLMFDIYFHDYYNHAIHHSYLWHYHHQDYDRSHWDAEKQTEYEAYKAYYESQGIKPNLNYVDPGTNRDEDYLATYVEKHPEAFYGDTAEVFTVEELPDEEALKQEIIASTAPLTTISIPFILTLWALFLIILSLRSLLPERQDEAQAEPPKTSELVRSLREERLKSKAPVKQPETVAAEREADVVTAAESDAETRAKQHLWFAVGYLGTVLGLALAYRLSLSPPAEQLTGKFPDDTTRYTNAYMAKARHLRRRSALTGFGISCAILVALYLHELGWITVDFN